MPRAAREPLTLTLARVRHYGPGQHFDTRVPNLFVRVTTGGARTYYLRYRDRVGAQRYHRLGRIEDYQTIDAVRGEAIDAVAKLRAGEDPKAEAEGKRLAATTVGDLWHAYWTRHATKHKAARSQKTDASNWRLHLEQSLATVPAAELKRRDVLDVHDTIAKDSPGAAARVIALLRKVYNFSVDAELLPDGHPNPCTRIRVAKTKQRMRFLDDAEYKRLFGVLAGTDAPGGVARLVEFLAYTGIRLSEAVGLMWERVRLDRRPPVIELVDHKTVRKVGTRYVKLGGPAAKLLRERQGSTATGSVFGVTADRVHHYWSQIREDAELDGRDGKERLRLHDLRHSFASKAIREGVQLVVLQRLLGHRTIQSTMVYAHVDDRSEADAAGVVAGAIAKAGEQ